MTFYAAICTWFGLHDLGSADASCTDRRLEVKDASAGHPDEGEDEEDDFSGDDRELAEALDYMDVTDGIVLSFG